MRIPDATERKVLIVCMAIAGLICSAPGDIVAAAILWSATLVFLLVHNLLLRREGASAGKPPQAPPPEPPTETPPETNAEV